MKILPIESVAYGSRGDHRVGKVRQTDVQRAQIDELGSLSELHAGKLRIYEGFVRLPFQCCGMRLLRPTGCGMWVHHFHRPAGSVDLHVRPEPAHHRDGVDTPLEFTEQQQFFAQDVILRTGTVRDVGEFADFGWIDFLDLVREN